MSDSTPPLQPVRVQPLEYSTAPSDALLVLVRGAGLESGAFGVLRLAAAGCQIWMAIAQLPIFAGTRNQVGVTLQVALAAAAALLAVSGVAIANFRGEWRQRAVVAACSIVVVDLIDGIWRTVTMMTGLTIPRGWIVYNAIFVMMSMLLPLSLAWFFRRAEIRAVLASSNASGT